MSVTRKILRFWINLDEEGVMKNVAIETTVSMPNPDNDTMNFEQNDMLSINLADLNAGDLAVFDAVVARVEVLTKRVRPLIVP